MYAVYVCVCVRVDVCAWMCECVGVWMCVSGCAWVGVMCCVYVCLLHYTILEFVRFSQH